MSLEQKELLTTGTWCWARIVTALLVSLLGPVWAWGQVLTLTPSLTVGERYDDNIFQDPDNEEDDFVTTIAPGIQLDYAPRAATNLTFSYQPAFQIFAENDDQNYVSHLLNIDVETPLARRFFLTASEQLLITEEPADRIRPVDDIDENPDDRPESSQNREKTIRNTATASLTMEMTPRTSLGLLFENLVEDVEDEDELDEVRYLLGTELGYLTDVARQNRAALSYNAALFTFSKNCDPAALFCQRKEDGDFTVHTVALGYEHNLSETLIAQASLGYSATVSDREDVDGNDAVVGGIGLIKTLRTGQLVLNFERVFTSGGSTADQVLSNRFVGRFRFQPTPKITTTLAGNIAFLNYQVDDENDLNNDDRTYFTIRPSIQYQMLRYLGFNAAYILAVSDYTEDERSDRLDQQFSIGAVLTVRAGIFVDLTYRYRDRDYDSTDQESRDDDEFTRNEVFLSVTYRPTFRF
jgi:hypothetical protein